MAIYVDSTTGKIIASPPGFVGIATAAACCCGAGGCPSDCSALGSYTATISYIGGGCSGCDFTYETGHTITRTGCTWNHTTPGQYEIIIDVSCAAGVWTCQVYFNCFDDITCFYTATLSGTIAAKADPTGTYNISGGGLTATVVIA